MVVLVVLGVGLLGVPTAGALSCAVDPGGSWARRHATGAVIGAVRSAADEQGPHDSVRTRVVVDVAGTFGPLVEDPAVFFGHPHWQRFEVGRTYLIPYGLVGGERTTYLCSGSPQVGANVADLTAKAAAQGWGTFVDAQDRPSIEAWLPTSTSSDAELDGTPWTAAGGVVLGLGVLGSLGVALRRRRRHRVLAVTD